MSSKKILLAIATLASSVGAAKVISLLFLPLITRLYTPVEYGAFVTFVAAIALIAPLLSLKYQEAIPVADTDSEAACLFNLAILSACMIVSLGVGAYIFIELVFDLAIDVAVVIFFLVTAFLVSLGEIYKFQALREKIFGRIFNAEVISALAGSAAKIAFFYTFLSGLGLLLGHLIHYLGMATYYRSNSGKGKAIEKNALLECALKYQKMPFARLPSHILLIAALQLPILAGAMLYDAVDFGVLGLAFTLISVPGTVIAASVSKAYFPFAVQLHKKEKSFLYHKTIKISLLFFICAIPFPAIIYLISYHSFWTVILGEEWIGVGLYLQILSVILPFQIAFAPYNHCFTILDRDGLLLKLRLFRLLLIALVVAVTSAMSLGIVYFICLYVLFVCLSFVLNAVFGLLMIRNVSH